MKYGDTKKLIEVLGSDMQGTVVQETGRPLVIRAYDTTLREQAGISLNEEQLIDLRGRSKIGMLQAMVYRHGDEGLYNDALETRHKNWLVMDEDLADFDESWLSPDQATLAQSMLDEHFTPGLVRNIPSLSEMPGASDTFRYLQGHGVYVAVATGFPEVVADGIVEHMGWKKEGIVDYATCDARAGGSRSNHNHMVDILIAAGKISKDSNKLQIPTDYDVEMMLKLGDTETDAKEGIKFGATTFGVLSGGHDRKRLEKHLKAAQIIDSIDDLPSILERRGYRFPR